MNPLILWRLAAGVFALLGIGGGAFGIDQQNKRKREQASNRETIKALQEDLERNEAELERLRKILGEKNDQVKMLAKEVLRQRAEIERIRKAA